ncbi:MAG: extracellular matrix regulator RemB [bacterium]
MFLHIGSNHLIKKSEIIGVFNIKSLTMDAKGKSFIMDILQNKKATDISDGKQSTLILTDSGNYITRISSVTLLQRGNSAFSADLEAFDQVEGEEPILEDDNT